MPIREATEQDIPRIVEMGSRSLVDGPYAGKLEDCPEQTAEFSLGIIRDQGKVVVSEDDGKLTGLFGFILYKHPFTGKQTAYELMWWVEPEYRKSFTGIALLRAAQRIARDLGAVHMQVSAPTEQVGQAYKALGYEKIEVLYQKDLIGGEPSLSQPV